MSGTLFSGGASTAGKPISGSGEIKIYRENDIYSMDVGIDEQIPIRTGEFRRVAIFHVI